jgi:hypothetical protein
MGGLASRWALTEANDAAGRIRRVSTVVTFGSTPYTGSAIANAGRKLLDNDGASKAVGAVAKLIG